VAMAGKRHRMPCILQLAAASSSSIDFQSDHTQFGRGDYHLSASVQEGDLVVYQTGTWLVDGVEVGEGTPPTIRYAKIETMQLVWTHNCEHGVLRGIEVQVDSADPFRIAPTMPLVQVQLGPEQLLARIPVTWHEEKEEGVSQVPFEDSMFACVMDE
jgi:ribosomal protein L27